MAFGPKAYVSSTDSFRNFMHLSRYYSLIKSLLKGDAFPQGNLSVKKSAAHDG